MEAAYENRHQFFEILRFVRINRLHLWDWVKQVWGGRGWRCGWLAGNFVNMSSGRHFMECLEEKIIELSINWPFHAQDPSLQFLWSWDIDYDQQSRERRKTKSLAEVGSKFFKRDFFVEHRTLGSTNECWLSFNVKKHPHYWCGCGNQLPPLPFWWALRFKWSALGWCDRWHGWHGPSKGKGQGGKRGRCGDLQRVSPCWRCGIFIFQWESVGEERASHSGCLCWRFGDFVDVWRATSGCAGARSRHLQSMYLSGIQTRLSLRRTLQILSWSTSE